MKPSSFGLTDVGRWRDENQDCFYADDGLRLYIVADGMGGLEGGAEAARYVSGATVARLRETLAALPGGHVVPARTVKAILVEVSASLRRTTGGRGGSTVVLALLAEERLLVANLGDSPAYLLSRGHLRLLTREHNLAGLMVEDGRLTRREAREHPLHSQLTAFAGMEDQAPVHLAETVVAVGDRLLLCSDGLTGMVPEPDIARALGEQRDTQAATRALVRMANAAGGHDNITVLLVDVE